MRNLKKWCTTTTAISIIRNDTTSTLQRLTEISNIRFVVKFDNSAMPNIHGG